MTEGVWFTQTLDHYERMKGKKAVKTTFEYDVKNTDLKWDVQRVRMMPDGCNAHLAAEHWKSIVMMLLDDEGENTRH